MLALKRTGVVSTFRTVYSACLQWNHLFSWSQHFAAQKREEFDTCLYPQIYYFYSTYGLPMQNFKHYVTLCNECRIPKTQTKHVLWLQSVTVNRWSGLRAAEKPQCCLGCLPDNNGTTWSNRQPVWFMFVCAALALMRRHSNRVCTLDNVEVFFSPNHRKTHKTHNPRKWSSLSHQRRPARTG